MPGHGIKQSAKNVGAYITKQLRDTANRFAAEPTMAEKIHVQKRNPILDAATFKNVRLANKILKESSKDAPNFDWQRRTRNNELAKSVALYVAPVATTGAVLAAYNKIKSRKDEDKMEKMSAEQYTDFVQKLAEEITDEVMTPNDGMEVVAGEDFEADEIASRAIQAYEAAQMRKQASEQDYLEACAYEDAAMLILDECEE